MNSHRTITALVLTLVVASMADADEIAVKQTWLNFNVAVSGQLVAEANATLLPLQRQAVATMAFQAAGLAASAQATLDQAAISPPGAARDELLMDTGEIILQLEQHVCGMAQYVTDCQLENEMN